MNDPIALWVTPVSNLAGVARHILDVARVGIPGWRLVVTAPEGPLLDRLRELGCPVIPLPVEGASTATSVAALRHTLLRLRPAIAHSHLAKADILLAMASVGLPVKLVTTEHHIPPDRFMFHTSLPAAVAMESVHRLRLTRFAHAIAVSGSTKRDMLTYWHTKTPITVILNGVDRPVDAPARTSGLRLLSLTRLSPEKNLDMTLRVFARILESHPEATLTLAGKGDDEARLRRAAASLGVADQVVFPGFMDAAEAMASHDVLLQPSKSDNCSYTLLDAVAQGLGVAASPIGGNPEILPAHCIADLDDEAGMARIAIEQGLDLGRRPTLPVTVPTVAGMARGISDIYFGIAESTDDRPLPEQAVDGVPEVSVIIAYFRNAATLGAQLEALARQVQAPRFEVVISDNEGSSALSRLAQPFSDQLEIRIVQADDSRGQCYARNRGVEAARGDILVMTDADDIVAPSWVGSLASVLRSEDAIVTGPLRLDGINAPLAYRTYLGVSDDDQVATPTLQQPFRFLGYESFAVGTNLGIRRSSYLRLGGMNPAFRGGSEDVDFSWRAMESGMPLRVAPGAIVDYRLRNNAKTIFRQRRGYQRSQLQLWSISRRLGRPVKPMSLRWAITETAKLPHEWLLVRKASEARRYRFAARAGGVVGNLEGQLRHRVLPRLTPRGRDAP